MGICTDLAGIWADLMGIYTDLVGDMHGPHGNMHRPRLICTDLMEICTDQWEHASISWQYVQHTQPCILLPLISTPHPQQEISRQHDLRRLSLCRNNCVEKSHAIKKRQNVIDMATIRTWLQFIQRVLQL